MTYLELILYLQAEMAKSEQTALAQPEQEPTQWRDMIVVSLVREGIDKHRARELADHFTAQPEQKPMHPELRKMWEDYFDKCFRTQPEQEPVAWILTDENINSIQVASVQRLIDRLKHAHHTDLCVRINGQDEWFQADWLKHMVRATPPAAQPEPVAFYHPRNGFYWAKPTSIFAPTAVDVPPMPLYAAADRNNG